MKRFRLLALMICAMMVGTVNAQTYVPSQAWSFSFKDANLGNNGYKDMNELSSDYPGWTFTNCYAVYNNNENGMQVGKTNGVGTAISPQLGVSGNITLLIKALNIYRVTGTIRYNVSVVDNEKTLFTNTYEVTGSNVCRPSAIFVTNCTPTSQICIESADNGSKFFIQSVKVFSIGRAMYYESFDYMVGNGAFSYNKIATSALCDNSASTTLLDFCQQSDYDLYIANKTNSKYRIKPITDSNTYDMLLSFKIGYNDAISNEHDIQISCANASLSDFNSTDMGNTASPRSLSLTGTLNEWHEFYMVVKGMTSNTTLTFTGTAIYLDDVMLTPIGLDQNGDNSDYISNNVGQVRNVTLQRTLTANIWCPLCLPFDITPGQMNTATGSTCQLCTLDNVNEGLFHFTDVHAGGTVAAGTPFLVKTDEQVENPTFSGVTISNIPAQTVPSGESDYQLVGIYSPYNLNIDGTHLFLGIDGNLYQPGSGSGENRLGGMRAYFVRPINAQNAARVVIDSGSNGIVDRETAEIETAPMIVDLQGRRVTSERSKLKGIYVRNGRKILMR